MSLDYMENTNNRHTKYTLLGTLSLSAEGSNIFQHFSNEN